MANKANMVIDQGTDFSTILEITDDTGDEVDLSGLTVQSQIRKYYTSNNSISFTATINNNKIYLNLARSQTANVDPGRYVYDIELVNSTANTVIRILEGIATITPEVTR